MVIHAQSTAAAASQAPHFGPKPSGVCFPASSFRYTTTASKHTPLSNTVRIPKACAARVRAR